MRLFVGVWPDPATVERIAGLGLRPGHGVRLVAPDRWHVTLQFLGDVDDDRVPLLTTALEQAVSGVQGPLQCTIGPATAWFSHGRVLHLPVAGLDDLAGAVRSTTRSLLSLAPEDPEFVGHLTLARRRWARRRASPGERLDGVPLSATFTVDHVDLVASELDPGGVLYTRVASFRLGG